MPSKKLFNYATSSAAKSSSLSLGPPGAAQTIREALAKGADRAIHIETSEPTNLRPAFDRSTSCQGHHRRSARSRPHRLQSDDLGYGQTGVVLAELLGYSHATIVMEVEPTGNSVRVKRELEDGWFQHVVLPLPTVLNVQSGIKKLQLRHPHGD